MVKSVWISSRAASATASRDGGGVAGPPPPERTAGSNDNEGGNGDDDSAVAWNNSMGEGAGNSEPKPAVGRNGGGNGNEGAEKSRTEPTVDFVDVHWELQKFMHRNSGSLSVPLSHPTLARIVDGLSESTPGGVEALCKKRWDDQLELLSRYKESRGGVDVPRKHPTLGNWVRIQREQFDLYEQGKPSALSKKRFRKLKDMGFGGGNGEKPKETTTDFGQHNMKSSPKENGKVKREEAASRNDGHDKGTIPDTNIMKEAKPNKSKERTKVSLKSDDKSLHNENERVKQEETDDTQNYYNENDTTSDKSKAKAVKPKKENSEEDERSTSPSPTDKINGRRRRRNSKAAKLKGKCDICEKNDGHWGHNLQQCKTCGLLVHELCYGMAETKTKDPNFECHACKAVGTSVEVNVPSRIGGCGKQMGQKRERVKQDRRPQECLLCNHGRGFHAMHPLLDTHGPEGRQLCIDQSVWRNGVATKERRLAWVHTLCANVINSNPGTVGSVYGCDKDRNYYSGEGIEDFSDEDEFVDEDNDSSSSAKEDEEEANEAANDREKEGKFKREDSCTKEATATCYYAISNESGWKKNIKEHRELKCFQCGKIDKKWMIPVQCTAGDDHELDRWKSRHKKGTECFVGMHVGCARWGNVEPEGSHLETIDGKKCRLCFFTPGRYEAEEDDDATSKDSYDKEKMQTIVSCYCKAHARDIVLNNPNRKAKVKVDREARSCPPPGNKTERQPRRNPATTSSRESRACPPQNLSEHAESSLKKSLASIRQKRGSIKKGTQKRRASVMNPMEAKFGAPVSKRTKVGFGENAVQFPVRGRSASALGNGKGPLNASSSSSASNCNNAMASILKKRDPGAPDRDNDGTPTASASSKKRRASTTPDLPAGRVNFKRIKIED